MTDDRLKWSDSALLEFLSPLTMGVLATANSDGPMAATIFVIPDPECSGRLFFKSRRASDHMVATVSDPRAALAIYRHTSTYLDKSGIQLRGRVASIEDPTTMARLVDLYSESFAGARERFAPIETLHTEDADSTLFAFHISSYKMLDPKINRDDHTYRRLT